MWTIIKKNMGLVKDKNISIYYAMIDSRLLTMSMLENFALLPNYRLPQLQDFQPIYTKADKTPFKKHLQHQYNVFHNFIDFTKAFYRVWLDALRQTMRKYNFDINTIEGLYRMATSAVLVNNEIGPFFITTVGVRRGCILSSVLFNVHLENIMQETLDIF
jgi:hypothetical protein